jgi:argininosuccinate lyase
VEIADEFASTSSIMPQKKNPDVLEIMRARSGKVSGNLLVGLTMIKSLPNSYNRDLQEVSPLVANSFGITKSSLDLLERILKSLKVNIERMSQLCDEAFITATELADFLVREKDIDFRKAHGIVGKIVVEATKDGLSLKDIDSNFVDRIYGKSLGMSDEKLKKVLSTREAVKSRGIIGGPSQKEVKRMIKSNEKSLSKVEKELDSRNIKIKDSQKLLLNRVEELVR